MPKNSYKAMLKETEELVQRVEKSIQDVARATPMTIAAARAQLNIDGDHHKTLLEQRAKIQEEIRTLREQKNDAKSHQDTCAARHKKAKSNVNDQQDIYSKASATKAKTRSQLRTLKRERKQNARRLERLKKKLDPIVAGKRKASRANYLSDAAKRQVSRHRSRLIEALKKDRFLREDIKIHERQAQSYPGKYDQEIADLKQQRRDNLHTINHLRARYNVAKAKEFQYNAENLSATIETMQAERQLRAGKSNIDVSTLQQEYQQCLSDQKHLNQQYTKQERVLEKAETDYKSARQDLKTLRGKSGEAKRELNHAKKEVSQVSQLQKQLDKASKSLANLSDKIQLHFDKLKTKFSKAFQGKNAMAKAKQPPSPTSHDADVSKTVKPKF